jgi:aminoglycoside/choline kinase family phosphotransferase
MISEALIDQTLSRFPRFERAQIAIRPLEKGGSDRKYYRIQVGCGDSLILVKYGDQRDENRHYVAIAQFLDGEGIRVPRIYFHDESEGLIWMEDLGEVDLWEHRTEAWPQRRALYFSALDQAALLHADVHLAPAQAGLKLQKEFNAELYAWERHYFFENCLERFFKIEPGIVAAHRDNPALEKIAAELAAFPRVLVHRDFQSQNIMVKNGAAYLIDFQGLRPGLAQYDLASLIHDPYVALSASERDELLDYYIGKTGVADVAEFRRIFDLCAMQRLMQALGAYGFLGLVKRRDDFLRHIPPALASLKQVISRISGLHRLGELLDTLH